jgi:hypothetical protein
MKKKVCMFFFEINHKIEFILFSNDRIFQVKQNEIIKNKIRQKVQIILNEMNSISSKNILEERKIKMDYFQLIYECIETHEIFLNFVNLKTRSQVEPDVDWAILKALLISKIK